MKKRKLQALFLAAALSLSLLAGCGNDQAVSSAPSSTPDVGSSAAQPEEADIPSAGPEEQSTADAPEASAQETLAEPEFDIYGPFSEETITLTYWKLWPPFLEGYDPMDASLFATLYDKLNVKVDVTTIGTDSAETKFNLMVASGDYLDIIENGANNYAGGATKGIADGVFLDLMPYVETYAPDYWAVLQQDEVAMRKLIDSNDQMASFVSMYDQEVKPQRGLWVRTDWLEEQNLEKPSTLEDLDQLLGIFKDQYGCSDAFALREDCTLPFQDVFGAYEWSVDEHNNVVYGYTEKRDAFKEYLKTGHEWYEKGYFSSEFISANDTTMPQSDMFLNGKTGMVSADVLIASEVTVMNPDIALGAVAPITKNADDKLPAAWTSRMNDANQAVISTNCETPEYAIAYINYAFTEEAFMAVNWGIEGTTYTMENGKPVFTDLMLNNPALPASFTPLAYISPGFPFLKSYDMALASYNTPAQQECFEIFGSKTDSSLPKTDFPINYLSFTTEESEVIALHKTDIDTYVTECLAKFITGAMDVDTEYDGFADHLSSMGSEALKEVYQSAYDRFHG